MLLAYTNRFLVLAQLIRQLKTMEGRPGDVVRRQIHMLRKRIVLTKRMQTYGVLSFFVCTLSMFALFLGGQTLGVLCFGTSLMLLSLSLLYSLYEVVISTNAINVELEDFEKAQDR